MNAINFPTFISRLSFCSAILIAILSVPRAIAAQRILVGYPLQLDTITAPAGTSSLVSVLGGLLEWELTFSNRASVFANYQANVSRGVVVLNGPEVGMRYFLWGELPRSEQGSLGTYKSYEPLTMSVNAGLGHRDYNFSQLEANQGDEVIKSRTLTSGSFLEPSAALQVESFLHVNLVGFLRMKYSKAVFYESKPIKIRVIDLTIGVGLYL